MMGRLPAALLVFGFALPWVPAADASSGSDKAKVEKHEKLEKLEKNGKHDESVRTMVSIFSTNDRDLIRKYYRNRSSSSLPPGLAKRDKLSPGIERQLVRNGTLPPGLQKRFDPFSRELNLQLPILSPGYSRGWIGGSAVIIDQRTWAIVDVIHNLLNSAGQ